jgi:hypothetical protein
MNPRNAGGRPFLSENLLAAQIPAPARRACGFLRALWIPKPPASAAAETRFARPGGSDDWQSWCFTAAGLGAFCNDACYFHGATAGFAAGRDNVPPLPFGAEQDARLQAWNQGI